MTPRRYQIEGAIFLAEGERALLGDPPGLGKTAQAILAARIVGARRIEIICPAIARVNWRREWRAWWPQGPEPGVRSYDEVSRDWRVQRDIHWGCDVLILDEAHYLKTPDSRRTKVIYRPQHPQNGLAAKARYVWALSGTFAPNDVREYWPHLRTLFPHLITGPGAERPMNATEFLQRYAHWTSGPYNVKVHAVKNRAELARILRIAGLRREIEEVLPELPPLVWGQESIDSGEARAEIRALEATPEARTLQEHIERNEDFRADMVHLATLRRLIGRVKARSVVELVETELRRGDYTKIVIWAHHREVIATLAAGLHNFGIVSVHGGTPPAQRARAVDAFQRDPATQIFLGQIQAAGTAITLTAANYVLFAESSWVPAEMVQAAKRCHRFGQSLPVFARVCGLAGSIDDGIAATLVRKLDAHVEIGESDAVETRN